MIKLRFTNKANEIRSDHNNDDYWSLNTDPFHFGGRDYGETNPESESFDDWCIKFTKLYNKGYPVNNIKGWVERKMKQGFIEIYEI